MAALDRRDRGARRPHLAALGGAAAGRARPLLGRGPQHGLARQARVRQPDPVHVRAAGVPRPSRALRHERLPARGPLPGADPDDRGVHRLARRLADVGPGVGVPRGVARARRHGDTRGPLGDRRRGRRPAPLRRPGAAAAVVDPAARALGRLRAAGQAGNGRPGRRRAADRGRVRPRAGPAGAAHRAAGRRRRGRVPGRLARVGADARRAPAVRLGQCAAAGRLQRRDGGRGPDATAGVLGRGGRDRGRRAGAACDRQGDRARRDRPARARERLRPVPHVQTGVRAHGPRARARSSSASPSRSRRCSHGVPRCARGLR